MTRVRPSRSSAPWRAVSRELGESLPEVRHPLGERAILQEVDFFLGKVDRGFGPHPQLEHALRQLVHLHREFALQRAQRGARGLCRAAVDQVGDRFGLREVELVVEVCALRELAGLRRSRTEFEHAAQQQVEHDRAAVPVQFEHVLAGERMRRREEQRQRRCRSARPSAPRRCEAPRRAAAARRPTETRRSIGTAGPETRTMPMPPRPAAVAIAAIVSVSRCAGQVAGVGSVPSTRNCCSGNCRNCRASCE